mmetsp:Transcript_15508/g.43408  ORF Transcript_15508/g.43408 Transcript_15508/m.43408 type:complete len:147 (-) Transcript_15508:194-634(-)
MEVEAMNNIIRGSRSLNKTADHYQSNLIATGSDTAKAAEDPEEPLEGSSKHTEVLTASTSGLADGEVVEVNAAGEAGSLVGPSGSEHSQALPVHTPSETTSPAAATEAAGMEAQAERGHQHAQEHGKQPGSPHAVLKLLGLRRRSK